MPLHYTKIFSIIALLTVTAFVPWLVWISVFEGQTSEVGGGRHHHGSGRAVQRADRAGELRDRLSWSLAPAAKSGSI